MRQTTLYRHFDINKKLLYVGISSRPWTRLKEHKISPWYDKIHNITLQQYEDREKALQEVRQITKLTMLDIKELLRKDHLSYYEIQWRANHKIKKVPGWAVIDLIEHLTYGRDK